MSGRASHKAGTRHFVRDSPWGAKRLDWRMRLANGYRDRGDECPFGLECGLGGALTTTPEYAKDLASLTLYGTDARDATRWLASRSPQGRRR